MHKGNMLSDHVYYYNADTTECESPGPSMVQDNGPAAVTRATELEGASLAHSWMPATDLLRLSISQYA